MLVLSRKSGQELRIGDDVVVTVLEVHGNVVKLGIQAPREKRILRGEIQAWREVTAPAAPAAPYRGESVAVAV